MPRCMQIYANTCKYVCSFVRGCWQVRRRDVVRSSSKTARRRAGEVRRSLIRIPAFLKSFCSSSCLNRPGLRDPQDLKALVSLSQPDQGNRCSDLRDLPFASLFSPDRRKITCARLRKQQNSERALAMRHPRCKGYQNTAFPPWRHLPPLLLTRQRHRCQLIAQQFTNHFTERIRVH